MALAVVVVLGLLGAAGTAQAQAPIMCPHPDPVCIPTGNYCGVSYPLIEWPAGFCGCSDTNPFSVQCTVSTGGTTCGGVTGCSVSCDSYELLDWPCTLEWERTGTPPSLRPPGQPAPTCAPSSAGKPVSLTTGEMFLTHTDAKMGDVVFSRTYNTARLASAARWGSFGPGWNASFEERVRSITPRMMERRLPDGTPVYYLDPEGDGTYRQETPHGTESWIQALGSGYTLYHRAGGSETFAANGWITTRTEPGGIQTSYLRDASGRLLTIRRLGRSLTLGYAGASTQPSTLSGPAGPIASYTYEGGRLKTVTYADGNADGQPDGGYTYNYDGAGRLTGVLDGDAKTIETHEYWPDGKAKTSEVAGGVERLTFTYAPGVTTVQDAATPPNVTTFEWATIKRIDRVRKVTGPCPSCGGGSDVQEWTYNADGWTSSRTDGEGNVTTYSYDAPSGDLLSETRTTGAGAGNDIELKTVYTYYADGRLHTVTAPNGALTTYTYVAAGPQTVTQTISATENRQVVYGYNTLGQIETVTDPALHVQRLGYSPFGDLGSSTDANGHVTNFDYDPMGRATKTRLPATTPPNDSPTTSYDARGRVSRVTNPNGTYWEYKYDGAGHLKSVRDPLGRLTTHLYDAWGRLTKTVDPLLGETEYGYDAMSNLTSLTDALDRPPTTYTYDGYRRVKRINYPSRGSEVRLFEAFTYDHAGRLSTRRDRKGVTTTFAYDGAGRVTGKTYSDGSPAVTFAYDANGDLGFLTSAANAGDTLGWNYDLGGQLLSETSARNGTTVSYLYDAAGRRSQLRLDGADLLGYSYHDDGRLQAITRSHGVAFDFVSDEAHRRRSMAFPNGTLTEFGYDGLSRLSLVRLKRGTTVLNEIGYESNDLNNQTARTESGSRLEYQYDELSRLLSVDRTSPPPTVRLEQYSYDALGNRTTALGVPGPWAYSLRNELTAFDLTSLAYDLNGSLLSRNSGPVRSYAWDVDSRLVAARDAGGDNLATFEYDPKGRRVAKRTAAGLTLFAYDGANVVAEWQPTGGRKLYLHGPGVDEPLAQEAESGARTYYHADGLGSIVRLTDPAGSVIASQAYDSFGRTATAPSGYGFTGRESDPETGLYYYRARYYEPAQGRFLSADPIRWSSGDANFYVYARNNPATWVDPSGLTCGVPSPSASPQPSPSPSPLGRPYDPAPVPWWFKLLFGTPRIDNPCPDGQCPAWIDDTGPNPHTDHARWVKWKEAFIKACEALGSGDHVAVCPSQGLNNHGGEGQISVCFCCTTCKP